MCTITIDHLLIASVSRDKTHPCTCRICKQRRLKMGMCTRTVSPCADPEGGRGSGPPLENHIIWVSIEISIWTPPPNMLKMIVLSSIGATIAHLTSLPVKDGGPHDFRSKMAAPTTPRWRPPRLPIQDGGPHGVRSKMAAPRSQIQDGGPCDAFGYTSEGESTP